VDFSDPAGAFGQGIYTSSSSAKAAHYNHGTGVLFLTKVVMGRPYNVTGFGQVSSCPSGYDSVLYDPPNGRNETILYTDDAIRPVFLIVLGE